MADSKRKQILDSIVTILAGIQADQPVGDPYGLQFSDVKLGPVDIDNHRKRFTAGVVPGRERKRDIFPIIECDLPVAIEFSCTINSGERAGDLAEQALAVIQRAIYSDKQLGLTSFVIDTKEVGNETDIEAFGDKAVAGAVFFEVKYRHDHRDVRI